MIIFDAETGDQIAEFKGHGAGIHSIVFAPDAKTLITSSSDQSIKFWHLETETEMLSLRTTVLPVVMLVHDVGFTRLVVGSRSTGSVRTIAVPSIERIDSN